MFVFSPKILQKHVSVSSRLKYMPNTNYAELIELQTGFHKKFNQNSPTVLSLIEILRLQ